MNDFDENVGEAQKEREKELEREAGEFVSSWAVSSDRFQHRNDSDRNKTVSRFFGDRDFSHLRLKSDHQNRPLWIDPLKGVIVLERFSPLSEQVTDFLITIAEPTSRPTLMHEYVLTAHSLYAAVSVGLDPRDIINTLDRFLKTDFPEAIRNFILSCSKSYGKVKLVLKSNKYFVESADAEILRMLLKDEVIGKLQVQDGDDITTTFKSAAAGIVIPGTKEAAGIRQVNLANKKPDEPSSPGGTEVRTALNDEDDEEEKEAIHSFEVPDSAVETVQKRCLELSYPILEEYDFRHDTVNADLDIDLRPSTQIRPYQEKSLSKLFGNNRAKSGIIVLPCGAGKTLVGITAACTIKKGVVVLCTSSVSAVQWRNEFLRWSNIDPDNITTFTAENKTKFTGSTGVIVTTYSMVTK